MTRIQMSKGVTQVSLLQKNENRQEGPQTEQKSVQRETIQLIDEQEKA